MAESNHRYPSLRRILHWTLASLVLTQICVMLLFRAMTSLKFGQMVLTLHLNVGVAILAVVTALTVVGFVTKAPPAPSKSPAWQKLAAVIVHFGLLALIFAAVVIGIMMTWARGYDVPLFFLFHVAAPNGVDFGDPDKLLVAHGRVVFALGGFIAVHIGAVVFNWVVRRVNVLSRMTRKSDERIFRNVAPIAVQLFFAFAVLIGAGAYVGMDALKHTRRMEEIAADTYDKTFLSVSHALTAKAAIKEAIGLMASDGAADHIKELVDSASSDIDEVVSRAPDDASKETSVKIAAQLKALGANPSGHVKEMHEIDAAIDDLSLALQGASFNARTAITNAGADSHDLVILAAAPTTAMAALAATFVWLSIGGLVARLRKMTRAISAADATADITVIGDGELAGLMRDVLACRESFATQRSEVQRLSEEVARSEEAAQKKLDEVIGGVVSAAKRGDFSKRAPEGADLGRFQSIALGLNSVCDAAERFLEAIDKQATALANGDHAYRLEGNFEGRFAKVAANVGNSTDAALKRFAAEVAQRDEFVRRTLDEAIGDVVTAARAGDFSRRAPETEDLGQFLKITQGLNAVCAEAERFLDSVEMQATALAGGDLTRQIEEEFKGRFAKVASNVNSATRALQETVAETRHSSEMTHAHAQSILHDATDLARREERQAQSISQTSTSMEQLTASVALCADNSRTAAKTARQAAARADQSLAGVAEAIEAVDRIDESSKQIAAIVSGIDEIAFQTRLLALNAAVEAARAGEAGRGFAVVAQEVRSLADSSASRAKDARNLVQESSRQVRIGVDVVRATGSAFQEIVQQARQVAERVDQISAAVDEQSRTIATLSKEAIEMDTITQQNFTTADAVRGTANELASEASRLAGLVSTFSTGDVQHRDVDVEADLDAPEDEEASVGRDAA